MSTDPFAPEPDPAEYEGPSNEDPTPPTAQEATPPVAVDFHPYSVTFKEGTGYDAAWLVAKYRTLDDIEADLSGPKADQMARILKRVTEVSSGFHRMSGGSSGGGQRSSGGNSGGNGKPSGANQAPDWMGTAPRCDHGTRVYKTGTSDYGAWHAWGCPAPYKINGEINPNRCNGPKNSVDAGLLYQKPPK